MKNLVALFCLSFIVVCVGVAQPCYIAQHIYWIYTLEDVDYKYEFYRANSGNKSSLDSVVHITNKETGKITLLDLYDNNSQNGRVVTAKDGRKIFSGFETLLIYNPEDESIEKYPNQRLIEL